MPNPLVYNSLDRPHRGTRLYPGGQHLWVGTALTVDTVTGVFGRDSGKSASMLFLVEEESSMCTHYYDAGYIAQSHAKVEERYAEWLARWQAIDLVVDHKNKDQLRFIKLRGWGKNVHGWTVHFLSGDQSSIDGARGLRLDRILLDEAGVYLTERVMAAVWSMGNSRQAKKYVCGTPSKKSIGFGQFKSLFDRGTRREAGYASFNAPSECAPWNDPEWILANAPGKDPNFLLHQRRAFRDPSFPDVKTPAEREEFDGEFISDLGAVFTNLDAVISLPVLREEEGGSLFIGLDPVPYHEYVIGQDWGLLHDHSTSAVMDRHTKEMVALRVEPTGTDYDPQLANLHNLHLRYNNAVIVGDGQGPGAYLGSTYLPKKYGDGYIDIKVTGTGEHSKEMYVTRMRRLFQATAWKLLQVPALREEFTIFRSEPMASRSGLRYNAPPGKHDDIVMACLYASYMIELDASGPGTPPKIPPGPNTYEGIMDEFKRQAIRNKYNVHRIGRPRPSI